MIVTSRYDPNWFAPGQSFFAGFDLDFGLGFSSRSRLGRGSGGVFSSRFRISSRSRSWSSALSSWGLFMDDKLSAIEADIDIPRSHAAAIGYFIMSFSTVDEQMNHAIWDLLGLRSENGGPEITTSIRDFGQRMLLLAKLGKARLRDEQLRDDCVAVVKAVQFLNDCRVELVHSSLAAWMPGYDAALWYRSKAERTQIKHDLIPYSTNTLCELTEYARLTSNALRAFGQNARRQQRSVEMPSLDKRPQLSVQANG